MKLMVYCNVLFKYKDEYIHSEQLAKTMTIDYIIREYRNIKRSTFTHTRLLTNYYRKKYNTIGNDLYNKFR